MDYKEEQAQEIEILESIYPDELEVHSETQFSILLKLDTESERKHSLLLNITYPETYPEEIPEISIDLCEVEEVEGAESDSEDEEEDEFADDEDANGGTKLVRLSEKVDLDSEDVEKLTNRLIDEANENIGMPSVFTLTSTLKDAAEEIFQGKLDQLNAEYEKELLEREREAQKKFIGTEVTKDSFEGWRLRFREEMGMNERIKERNMKLHNGKLSGKEIFEQGLAGEMDGEDDAVDLKKGVEKLAL